MSKALSLTLVYFRPTRFIFVALGVGLGLAGCTRTPYFEDEYERFESVQVGMSEQKVTAMLGKPLHVYSKADAPESYYVEGYSFQEREINNKVLIFVASEAIAYVYLDKDNKVEEVFVGGS